TPVINSVVAKGRTMKGAEIFIGLSCAASTGRARGIGEHLDGTAGLDPILAVGHHQIAGLQTLGNDRRYLVHDAGLERALLDLVIRPDDERKGTIGTVLDR